MLLHDGKAPMTSNSPQPHDFETAKARLKEIADAVSDESLPLDDALDLFEEAVALGLKVTDFVEEGIVVTDEKAVALIAASDPATSEAPAGSTAPADPEAPADPADPEAPEAE